MSTKPSLPSCLVRKEERTLRRTSVPVPVLQVDTLCYNSVLKRYISVKALSGLGSRWFVRILHIDVRTGEH